MSNKKLVLYGPICAAILLLVAVGVSAQTPALTPIEELGKALFFDTNLSTPPGMDCAFCHGPDVGYTGPISEVNAAGAAYPGVIHARAGNRKPPAAAYAGDSPVLHYDEADEVWVGGMFWDGRATGWTLGDPLAEQAQGPFLNPLEQKVPNARQVCLKVSQSSYAELFEEVWGPGSLDCKKDVEGTYERIARSIAAYERSAEVNPFSSRFDRFWDAVGADVVPGINMSNWESYKGQGLSDEELWGLALFNDEEKGMCALCHTYDTGAAGYPLFTDFTYDNLGVPKNPQNPFYDMPPKWNPDGEDWLDYGLGAFLQSIGEDPSVYEPQLGKVKVPTLRNVDKSPSPDFIKAYTHNGYFKTLEGIVHFYNTRDSTDKGTCPGDYTEAQALAENCWPAPEVDMNVNQDELGDLGLSPEEEGAIVAFLRTLSDE